jgi:small subunit ribosomal protein S20
MAPSSALCNRDGRAISARPASLKSVDVATRPHYKADKFGGKEPLFSFSLRVVRAHFERIEIRLTRQVLLAQEVFMANTPSAKKATRKIERRTEVNKTRRSRMRTFLRRVEEAIASGKKDEANAALKDAQPLIHRAADHGIVHRNAASRKISRLSKRIKSLA